MSPISVSAPDEQPDDWNETWNAREAALKSILGQPDDMVYHALIPFRFGGQADVLCFRNHIPGRVAATCELLGEEAQKRNVLGTYELMIAHRELDNDWGPKVISRLARYTCDVLLEPGHTMDIGSAVPKGSTIVAFLFCDYARFSYRGQDAGLLLCLGLTRDELRRCRSGPSGRDEVFNALRTSGAYPYTDLYRASALPPQSSFITRLFRRKH